MITMSGIALKTNLTRGEEMMKKPTTHKYSISSRHPTLVFLAVLNPPLKRLD